MYSDPDLATPNGHRRCPLDRAETQGAATAGPDRGCCGKEPEQGDRPFVVSSAYSWRTTDRNPADNAVVTARIAAMASNPKINGPVNPIQPIMKGPKKPPSEPIVVMKARPPAAPRPVRKLVGTVQKIARAEVTPTSATVSRSEPAPSPSTRPRGPSRP